MKNNKIVTSFQQSLLKKTKIALIGPLKREKYFNLDEFHTIFIDGGSRHLKKNIQNCLIIGDGDSSPKKTHFDLKLSKTKDFSDLKMALDIVAYPKRTLYIDGLVPYNEKENRFDHQLANLGEFYQWTKINKGTIYLSSNIILLPKGKHRFLHHGPFSLMSLNQNLITLKGRCKYKIKLRTSILPFSSHLLSNNAFGLVTLEISEPIFLIKFNE
jgi:thiamine pyrophosphokinase